MPSVRSSSKVYFLFQTAGTGAVASESIIRCLLLEAKTMWELSKFIQKCQGPHQRLLYHPFKVLVALLFLSKHKNLFCLDDTLNGMANNTHRPHAELEK
jgi:hypothetical protein